jgi:hypothetical protein
MGHSSFPEIIYFELFYCIGFGRKRYLSEVTVILLLQNFEYLGCTIRTHQIAIHPEISEGLPEIIHK